MLTAQRLPLRAALFVCSVLLCCPRRAHALIYLPENTLESMLVRADAIVIGTIAEISPATNRGALTVEETLKGTVPDSLPIAGVMLQVDTNVQKPRFAKGDRVVLFLGPRNADLGTRPVIHSQILANDAEVHTMKACIAEITPVAQVLADLGNLKKEIQPGPLRGALVPLVASKNAYSQIIVGRLMATRLATRVKPEGWEELIIPALTSPRKELAQGALAWAAAYGKLPTSVRAALEKVQAESADATLKKDAAALLKK